MRALALLLALAVPAPAAPAPAREFTELPPGRYTIVVTGLVTTVCARAIAAEWAALPEVEAASVDFDKSVAQVAVRLDSVLPVASLRKTLRRAEKTSNLGARYDLRGITYRIGK